MASKGTWRICAGFLILIWKAVHIFCL